MSVQPYTSPQAPPLDTSGDGSSGGTSIPANSPVPDLAVVWGDAPSFVPQGSGNSSGQPPNVPVAADLSVDLGSLRDAENSMLGASRAVVDSYEALKQQFESVKNTVFGQGATDEMTPHFGAGEGTGNTNQKPVKMPNPIGPVATSFANGEDGKPGMNDLQAFALQQIGNAMALVGEFVALMNSAGSSYATADSNSALPPIKES